MLTILPISEIFFLIDDDCLLRLRKLWTNYKNILNYEPIIHNFLLDNRMFKDKLLSQTKQKLVKPLHYLFRM